MQNVPYHNTWTNIIALEKNHEFLDKTDQQQLTMASALFSLKNYSKTSEK